MASRLNGPENTTVMWMAKHGRPKRLISALLAGKRNDVLRDVWKVLMRSFGLVGRVIGLEQFGLTKGDLAPRADKAQPNPGPIPLSHYQTVTATVALSTSSE
jgi:hypothetical protein